MRLPHALPILCLVIGSTLGACASDEPAADAETSAPDGTQLDDADASEPDTTPDTAAPELVEPETVADTAPDIAIDTSPVDTTTAEVSTAECERDSDCGPAPSCKRHVCDAGVCTVANAPDGISCNREACLYEEACLAGECTGGEPSPSCSELECGKDSCGRSCGTCGAGKSCVEGACLELGCAPGVKRVFVTSQSYDGALDAAGGVEDGHGLEGGDALCALVAEAAGLQGNWRAWLSADGVDAIDRIDNVGPWHSMAPFCPEVFPTRAAITVYGPEVAIDYDERGKPATDTTVWTGTGEDGRSDGLDCEGWTRPFSTAGGFQFEEGLVGVARPSAGLDQPEYWTSFVSNPCHFENALYCFEQ